LDCRLATTRLVVVLHSYSLHLPRGCGLALIELTSILEEEDAVLDRSIDPLGVALVAYAARGRRLLRSAYRLLDANEAPEAVPLLRIVMELYFVATGSSVTLNVSPIGLSPIYRNASSCSVR
jgi:hypothetical protein